MAKQVTTVISGQVIDVESGEPLSFSKVFLSDRKGNMTADRIAVMADAQGRYKLTVPLVMIPRASGVPLIRPKASHVSAYFVGYTPMSLPLVNKKVYNFDLKGGTELETVVVTADRVRPPKKPLKVLLPGERYQQEKKSNAALWWIVGGVAVVGLAVGLAVYSNKKALTA